MEKFRQLGISENILKVIHAKKFEEPSEIQEKAIPLVLQGKDIIAGASTGSGKTLAFGSGIIPKIQKGKGVQGLVLTPTRELAEQVAGALREFSFNDKLEVAAVYGGVSMLNQVKQLSYAEVVVATPGRLLDHIGQRSIDLSKVKVLVLDEADRMWDMGFKEDVGRIVSFCPKERQTMLFTATISHELADFASRYMRKDKIEVSVESQVDPSKLKQVYYDVRDDEKFSLLVHLLRNEKSHLVMIFCNTRRIADTVSRNLEQNKIDAQVIHGGMEQNKRNKVLKNFDNSKVSVLVCTDVAARGLDIKGVSHVYNYDVPKDAKDYIHRIGRTARAGAEGIAVNLIASRDYDSFSNLQRSYSEIKIERVMTPRFEKVFVKMPDRRERRSFGQERRGFGGGRGRGRPDFRGREQRGQRNKRADRQGPRRFSSQTRRPSNFRR
jgi:ATP-dependent RNA helicase DeaD